MTEEPQDSSPRLCKHKHSCLYNTLLGGLRAGGIALGTKAAVHILINVLLKQGYKQPLRCLISFLTTDNLRFVGFLTLLSTTHRAVLCSLRKLRNVDDGWNALIAGAASGLALSIESKSRQEVWSLYFFARVFDIILRGLANRGLPVNVNLIESCAFAVMIIFMLYCYSVEPDNMVKSYYSFLNSVFYPLPAESTILQVYKDEAARMFPLKPRTN
mmetsp:Transcript_7337/g.13589  ORF Transcript_7337/g.13589 Transcript_7337/m.13589 type:complete len:215 (-) Transcript_7337:1311-1955(-)